MSSLGFESVPALGDSLSDAFLCWVLPVEGLRRFFGRNRSGLLFLVDTPSRCLEGCETFLSRHICPKESFALYPVRFERLKGKARTVAQTLSALLFLKSAFSQDLHSGLVKQPEDEVLRKILEMLHSHDRDAAVRFLECRFCSADRLNALGVQTDLSLSDAAESFLCRAIETYVRVCQKTPVFLFDVPLGDRQLLPVDNSLIDLCHRVRRTRSVHYIVLVGSERHTQFHHKLYSAIESKAPGTCGLVHVRKLSNDEAVLNQATRIVRKTMNSCRDPEKMREIEGRYHLLPGFDSSVYPFTENSIRFLVREVAEAQRELNPIVLRQAVLDLIGHAIDKRLLLVTRNDVTSFLSSWALGPATPDHLKMLEKYFDRGDLHYERTIDRIKPLRYLEHFDEIDRILYDLGYVYTSSTKSWQALRHPRRKETRTQSSVLRTT